MKDSWRSPAFPLLSFCLPPHWQWPWVKAATKQGSSWELLVDIQLRHLSLQCLTSPVCKASWVPPVCVLLLNTKKQWRSSWLFGFLSSNREELVQLVGDTMMNCSEQGHFLGLFRGIRQGSVLKEGIRSRVGAAASEGVLECCVSSRPWFPTC